MLILGVVIGAVLGVVVGVVVGVKDCKRRFNIPVGAVEVKDGEYIYS